MAFSVSSYGEAAADRRPITGASAANASAAAVGMFVVLLALLHFIEPQFDPTWRFVSEYSNGPHGWVMRCAFFTLAFGCAASIVAIRPHVHTKPAMIGLFFLGSPSSAS